MRHLAGRSPRVRWFLVVVVALVVWTALAVAIDNGRFGVFQDDGLYLTAARSLRDGRGFGLPSRPGEPPPKYPIGLPATLALALWLDPRPPSLDHEIAVARGLVVVGGWGFFLAAHAWLRRSGVGPALACGIILATAFHHVVLIGGASTLFADLPFAAVCYWLLARFVAPSGVASRRLGLGWVQGALAGFAFLLRSNGITLIAATLVAAGWGGARGQGKPARPCGVQRRTWLGALVGVAVVVLPSTWYAGLHPRSVASNSYLLEMKAGWSAPGNGSRVVARNVESMVFDFPTRVVLSPTTYMAAAVQGLDRHPAVAWLIRSTLTVVVTLGLIRLARTSRRSDLPAWTHAVGSVAIFAVWPWNGIMDRFLLSLLPMVLLAFSRGIEQVLRFAPGARVHRRTRARWVGLTLALVVLGNVAVVARAVGLFRSAAGQWPGAPNRADLDRALGFIRARTEPDAVVAAAWPELVYLHTGRTTVPLFEDEAILFKRFGDVSKLQLWRELVPGRPFYLLHRGPEEDADRADETQVAALIASGSRAGGNRVALRTQIVAQTPDGRYRLSRLLESPAEAGGGAPRR